MSYSEENGQVATKERPILFSGEMVRAILEGRKTQTRRIAKVHDAHIAGMISPDGSNCARSPQEHAAYCPHGQPGDRLWVREAFQPLFAEGVKFRDADWQTGKGYAIRYVATDGRTDWLDPDDSITDRCKPGIHMPRWASRLTLEVAKVRIERVQEISELDCYAEGVQIPVEKVCDNPKAFLRITGDYPPIRYMPKNAGTRAWLRAHFASLWDSINAKRGFGWDANPWVWVIEFQRKS